MRSVGEEEGTISQRLWVTGVFIISGYETKPFEILVVLFSLTSFLLAAFKNLKPCYLGKM